MKGRDNWIAMGVIVFVLGYALGFGADNSDGSLSASTSSQFASDAYADAPIPRQLSAYRNCAAARAAGVAPVRRGEPGYGPHLDRDNDGVGCEPWPR